MENASKALIMAGGVLIGILILALAVYLFASFGAESRRIQKQIDETQLTQYNAQYTIYSGADRNDITIYDIISVANLAAENNKYYGSYPGFTSEYRVQVDIKIIQPNLQDATDSIKQSLLDEYSKVITLTDIPAGKTEENIGEIKQTFKCDYIDFHANGRVSYIRFIKV